MIEGSNVKYILWISLDNKGYLGEIKLFTSEIQKIVVGLMIPAARGVPSRKLTQSAEAVEYTDCISAKVSDSPNKRPDMTLNNLMVRLQ